jgi:thiol-disulfide isomerase/thioredoxin
MITGKKLMLFFMLVLFQMNAPVFAQQKGNVFLGGSLKNFDNQIEIEDMSEMSNFDLPPTGRLFNLDSLNRFSIGFHVENPGYFRVGRNILYLSPGDRLDVFIDYNDPLAAVFKGMGTEKNEYLKNTPFPHGGSFLQSGRKLKLDIQQTINDIFSAANTRREELGKIKKEYGDFKKLEKARIEIDILNSILSMENYYNWKLRGKADSLAMYIKECKRITAPYIKEYSQKIGLNPLYLQLSVYQYLVYDLFDSLPKKTPERNAVKEWMEAASLTGEMKYAKSKKYLYALQDKIKEIKTKKYRSAAIKTFNMAKRFGIGDVAEDFTMRNSSNENVPLSSFKGKIIYIDIWATWCGPCLQEMPYLDSLKRKYKDNDQVVFVSLSIDNENDKDKWLAKLKQKNDFDNQFIINRIMLEPYSVQTIPRTILINKDFRVEEMYGDEPSSKETKKSIDALLLKK